MQPALTDEKIEIPRRHRQLHQGLSNPSEGRKIPFHRIAPCMFGAAGRKSRTKKDNMREVSQVKKKKNIKIKGNRYKCRIKHSEKVSDGGFAEIYAAKCYIENEQGVKRWEKCAVKRPSVPESVVWRMMNRLTGTHSSSFHAAQKEVNVLKELKRNEFILQLYTSFKAKGTIYIVTEFAEIGDLCRVLNKSKALPRHRFTSDAKKSTRRFQAFMVRFIMTPIFSALAHMHAIGYVHRDVKPQNILMFADGTPKLCDFGTTVSFKQDKDALNDVDRTQVGSGYYMAPETICFKRYNETLDTWQIGISMLVLVFGGRPYEFKKSNVRWKRKQDEKFLAESESIAQWFKNSAGKSEAFDQEILEKLNLDRKQLDGEPDDDWLAFRSFASRCFAEDVRKRPACAQLLQDDYLAPVAEAWNSKDFSDFREEKIKLDEIITRIKPLYY